MSATTHWPSLRQYLVVGARGYCSTPVDEAPYSFECSGLFFFSQREHHIITLPSWAVRYIFPPHLSSVLRVLYRLFSSISPMNCLLQTLPNSSYTISYAPRSHAPSPPLPPGLCTLKVGGGVWHSRVPAVTSPTHYPDGTHKRCMRAHTACRSLVALTDGGRATSYAATPM